MGREIARVNARAVLFLDAYITTIFGFGSQDRVFEESPSQGSE